jgi:hypothetical protein
MIFPLYYHQPPNTSNYQLVQFFQFASKQSLNLNSQENTPIKYLEERRYFSCVEQNL